MEFEAFIKEAEEQSWRIHGIEVFQDGEVIHRRGDCRERRYPIYSATKTFTSTAAGIAADEGKLSIQESIYEYLKPELPVWLGQKQVEALKKITVQRLLTMSVQGYPFRPEGPDWLEFSLFCELEAVEVPRFSYSNIQAYLVGVAVERAVGEHLISYLTPRLLDPLGIRNPVYGNCPRGHFYGASAMALTVNELSRLGQLYLQRGSWQGNQLVSEDWIRSAVSRHIANREGGYGYFIWLFGDGYRISGKWGQRCFVFPGKNRVITYLSDMEKGSGQVTEAVERYLI